MTGYWVSVVSEDWRHRMMTPRKGDYESVPLNGDDGSPADPTRFETLNALKSCAVASASNRAVAGCA